jgi:hypothetical protein
MSVRLFRFSTFDSSRLRSAFAPRKPRNALLRVVFGLLGLGLLAVLLVFGLFVGAAMLGAGLLLRLWRQRKQPIAADPRVVDAEYRVVRKPVLPLPR